MIYDDALQIADGFAMGASTINCTDFIPLRDDTTGRLRDFGGEPLLVEFTIRTTASGGTSASFRTITSDDASGSNVVVQYSTPSIVTAQLVAGKRIYLPFHMPVVDTDAAYLGVQVVYSGTLSGSFDVHVVPASQIDWRIIDGDPGRW